MGVEQIYQLMNDWSDPTRWAPGFVHNPRHGDYNPSYVRVGCWAHLVSPIESILYMVYYIYLHLPYKNHSKCGYHIPIPWILWECTRERRPSRPPSPPRIVPLQVGRSCGMRNGKRCWCGLARWATGVIHELWIHLPVLKMEKMFNYPPEN